MSVSWELVGGKLIMDFGEDENTKIAVIMKKSGEEPKLIPLDIDESSRHLLLSNPSEWETFMKVLGDEMKTALSRPSIS